jgi:quinone-modifying oxidoreductase subunit QmoA
VCCKYSLKLAQLLKKIEPKLSISYYFMDWRPCNAQDDLYAWAKSANGVELVRSRPSEIVMGSDGRPEVRYTSPLGENVVSKRHDIVILSQGIRPAVDAGPVCDKLGLERDESGFVKSNESEPCRTNRSGIFVAGCVRSPMDLVDSVSDGAIAAGKAYSFLEEMR